MENEKELKLNVNTIELHYWLKNQSHSMDAFVQNKCELELLNIIDEITRKFNAKLLIETEPFGNGGLRRWFTLAPGTNSQKNTFYRNFIITVVTSILVSPIGTSLAEISKNYIERSFEDKELKDLTKDKLKIEIENFKADLQMKVEQLSESKSVIKRRSNFYLSLKKYPKADKISFLIEDQNKNVQKEVIVQRNDFDKYITFSEELDPIIIEDAVVEIISPILIKENYKWRGIYNGQTLSFNMLSNEFKTLVQLGRIEFKHGSTIKCVLEINRKMSNGEEVITGYDIISVNTDSENDSALQISKE